MPGIIGCQVACVRENLEIVDGGTYLSRVAIWRIGIHVTTRGGLLVLLIRGRGHRRGLRRRHVRRLLLRLQRHRREHLHVPLALARPDSVCSANSTTRAANLRKQQICIRGEKGTTRCPGAVRKETKQKKANHALTADASATLLYLNGLKSSLICTSCFLSIRVPKNGFGVAGTAAACVGAGVSEVSHPHHEGVSAKQTVIPCFHSSRHLRGPGYKPPCHPT